MSVFKCKMCGGTIEFEQGATVGVCDSCGSKQTLPRLDDDKKANLYDRANHFRRNNDYDKAMGIYEYILSEDNTDAEAYWSLVLCRYGIEYVEDPKTHRRVPTINRVQFTSVLADEDYKSALKYADADQKQIYESEAKTIDEIQKGILEISSQEEPFDVFICYKETDADGCRTQDSVLATELYHGLTEEGFKVFFSRITLEGKLGTAYEPYIFAALNSAKVMVVLSTSREHFNAVWVKNEWSRYLKLIKNGAKKMLIPAYRDMDPYDLPDEFSHLQAQDMSKLGFMQDLIRGIKKLIPTESDKLHARENAAANTPLTSNTGNLLERTFLFLEEGKWQDADNYCEKVLDIDLRNADAYLGKLMADCKVRTRKQLADCEESFEDNDNYAKAIRFGNEQLKSELREYAETVSERVEQKRMTDIYNHAVSLMTVSGTEENCKKAAEQFRSISGFMDADDLAGKCLEKAEALRKDAIYDSAVSSLKSTVDKLTAYENAIEILRTISGWRDTDERISDYQKKIDQIIAMKEFDRMEAERRAEENRIAAEKAAKRRKKIIAVTVPVICACTAFIILLTAVIIPHSKLDKAMSLIESGDYDTAYAILEELGKDETIASNKYDRAMKLIESGDYHMAVKLLKSISYKDSVEKANQIITDYPECKIYIADVGDIVTFGTYEQDNDTSNGNEKIEWRVMEKEADRILILSDKAIESMQYNTEYDSVTWETCSLRAWLNDTFYNAAFSSEEQSRILTTTVTADKNPDWPTSDPGKDTSDKVFLLSVVELNKYFITGESKKCVPTAYAKAKGLASELGVEEWEGDTCWWILRSPGRYKGTKVVIKPTGEVYDSGSFVNIDAEGVRPAMWINLE